MSADQETADCIMKVSIITVTYNSESTVRDTLESVQNQTYQNIEHIVVDGLSTDGTVDIIQEFENVKIISERDKGIYDAMNKGIKMATGDIVGILNSDDFFFDRNVVKAIVDSFSTAEVDCIFGDVVFVSPHNLQKVVRYYSSAKWTPARFAYGYMPAHPSFYVKRSYFADIGYYNTNFKIASDFELLVRFLYNHKLTYKYLNQVMVVMRTGGISTKGLKSTILLNQEIVQACLKNGNNTNLLKVLVKVFNKSMEYINPARA